MIFPVRISIAALVYRSTRFADSVVESLVENTPGLSLSPALTEPAESGVRFFFVANDPEPQLVSHLIGKKYPWVLNRNRRQSEGELFRQGYATPEYISRVYRGWNVSILHGDEICVLVNSDHIFSPGWLDPLIRALLENEKQFVCSQTIELPGRQFGGAWQSDFGQTPDAFASRKQEFLDFVAANRQPGVVRPSGVFMPVAFWRKYAIGAGLYPEGNLHGGSYGKVAKFGDAAFFERAAERYGVEHVTAMDSIVYHFGEGEMRE